MQLKFIPQSISKRINRLISICTLLIVSNYAIAQAPTINYTPLVFNCNTSSRTITATITDGEGVPTTGTLVPRLYFRKNANSWVSNPGTLSSGTSTNGNWTFTLLPALMGGLAIGDAVQYYITAQDIVSTPNISANPSAGFAATNVNTIITHPTTPNGYTVGGSGSLSGNYTVGVGQYFTTISAAVTAFNTSCINSPVTFELTDPLYNEAGQLLIYNPIVYNTALPTMLTIQPSSGSSTIINATVPNGAVFKIINNGVNINGDQDFLGTIATRNITIQNLSTTNPSGVWVASANSTQPIENVLLNNLTIKNGTSTGSGITAADVNDKTVPGFIKGLTIAFCSIEKVATGINMNCSNSNINAGASFSVQECLLNATGANAIGNTGIYMVGNVGGLLIDNQIGNFDPTANEMDRGVWFDIGASNIDLINNKITSIGYSGAGNFSGQGIVLSTGYNNVDINIANNFISNIYGVGSSYLTNGAQHSPVGIYMFGLNQFGTTVQSNSINMYGATLNTANAYSCGIAVDDGSKVFLKNNIIQNSLGRVGANGAGAVGIAMEQSNSFPTSTSNYNDIFVNSNIGGGNYIGKIGTNNYTTLATWQAASANESNSVSIQPNFVSNTDLHLVTSNNATLNNLGTSSVGITNDIDYDTRNATTPDMGADEFTPTAGCAVLGGTTVASPSTTFCKGDVATLSLTGVSTGAGYTYQWQSSPDGTNWSNITGAIATTYTTTNLLASIYFQCVVTCTATSTSVNSTILFVTVNNPTNANGLAGVVGGVQVCKTQTVLASGTKYFDNNCNLIAKVEPSGAPAVSGNITTCVKIDGTVQIDADGRPYVQRHFDVEPATNAANAQGIVKMYFTANEFIAYNNYVTSNSLPYPLLPTGTADNGNAKITQFHGTGTAPGNYVPGTISFGTAICTWDAANSWWEVSFPAMGFSGFYLHTGPASLLTNNTALTIAAQVTGVTNTVSWTTATEANNRKFVVERSSNGTSFAPIGEVATRAVNGNSNVALNYSFVDANPVQGKQYYRLQMIDNGGRATYSQIVTLRRGAGKLEIVDVRPNPTTANLYFNLLGVNNNSQFTLTLRTVEGKTVLIKYNQTPLGVGAGAGVIDMSKLANGLYILEAVDVKTGEKGVFKVVKQ